jgi:DNA-binding NarL/FixJ family response regulator
MRLVSEGYQNREIGRALNIEEETVKSHVKNILWALDARNRTHAVALYLKSEGAASK